MTSEVHPLETLLRERMEVRDGVIFFDANGEQYAVFVDDDQMIAVFKQLGEDECGSDDDPDFEGTLTQFAAFVKRLGA